MVVQQPHEQTGMLAPPPMGGGDSFTCAELFAGSDFWDSPIAPMKLQNTHKLCM